MKTTDKETIHDWQNPILYTYHQHLICIIPCLISDHLPPALDDSLFRFPPPVILGVATSKYGAINLVKRRGKFLAANDSFLHVSSKFTPES